MKWIHVFLVLLTFLLWNLTEVEQVATQLQVLPHLKREQRQETGLTGEVN